MNHADFQAAQFRLAAFTPGLRQLAASQVVGALLESFTGEPMVLPIPVDAPPELPRITLREPSKRMELQIALSRSDLLVSSSPGANFVPKDVIDEATPTLENVLRVLQVRPGRLALIGTYFHACQDPAAALAQHFCKAEWVTGPLVNIGALELHAHKRLELLEGLTVNSWIRCKTGTLTQANVAQRAVVLERDVNTLAEEVTQRTFTADEVSGFMNQAVDFLATEIENFFPALETESSG